MTILLLLTLLFIGAATVIGIFAIATGRQRLVGVTLASTAVWMTGYFGAIAWFSMKTPERVLDPPAEYRLHRFELDPHFVYTVTGAKPSKDGYRVTLQVESDARVAMLEPPPLLVTVVDPSGRELDRREVSAESFGGKMAPGEKRDVVVDIRTNGAEPLITLESGNTLDRILSRFIINHDQSFGHKKTRLRLPAMAEIPAGLTQREIN
jgi:hypothetical protein